MHVSKVMEESTASKGDSSTSKMSAAMKYDDAVLKFADARLNYKNSILKYRDLIKERELSALKKLTYVGAHQFADVKDISVPQLTDLNEKRERFIDAVKLDEKFDERTQNVHNELNMISRVLSNLEKEKERLS